VTWPDADNRRWRSCGKESKLDNVTIGPGFNLAQLAGDGRIATGDVRAVPVGKYAKAALEKLGSWDAAAPKFAMTENVRAALILVAPADRLEPEAARGGPALSFAVGTQPAGDRPAHRPGQYGQFGNGDGCQARRDHGLWLGQRDLRLTCGSAAKTRPAFHTS